MGGGLLGSHNGEALGVNGQRLGVGTDNKPVGGIVRWTGNPKKVIILGNFWEALY